MTEDHGRRLATCTAPNEVGGYDCWVCPNQDLSCSDGSYGETTGGVHACGHCAGRQCMEYCCGKGCAATNMMSQIIGACIRAVVWIIISCWVWKYHQTLLKQGRDPGCGCVSVLCGFCCWAPTCCFPIDARSAGFPGGQPPGMQQGSGYPGSASAQQQGYQGGAPGCAPGAPVGQPIIVGQVMKRGTSQRGVREKRPAADRDVALS
eukprot:CAMPEP_0180558750 /NCGR_PEP_ID=MMETSP1037_2-20121125/1910_1 /TAXON_ID=632150 /ORGANISM="Azadinium spinosum, Strain 3D9" /LENGTH=205 /DNA_ID=CAMNT_0022575137 /DNA_START=111 /DNA_END=728 /DNA_ORIENTATION=+